MGKKKDVQEILFVFVLLNIVSGCSSSLSKSPLMASDEDPPLGVHRKYDETVRLGHYKTCRQFGRYIASHYPWHQRFVVSLLQDMSVVDCQDAHTCHCHDDEYYVDRLDGFPTVYKCIESEGTEEDDIYEPSDTFPGRGVIKFAKPRSVCDKKVD